MRKKQMIALIIVLAAIIVAIFGVKAGKNIKEQKEAEAEEAATVYVSAFDVSDVTAFTYLSGDSLLMFTLEDDGTWTYSGDETMELDSELIEEFLTDMSSVSANAVIEDAEDTSQYGVDDPTQMFAVVFSDGSSETWCFGSENEIVGGYYVQVTNDADETNNGNVYLVKSSVLTSTLSQTAEDFQVEEEDEDSSVSE